MLKNKKIISIIMLLIAFSIIAIFVSTKNNLIIDQKMYTLISKLYSDSATVFFKVITQLGNAKIIGLLCIILLLFSKTRNKIGIPISMGVVVTGVLNILLKNIFERQRPLLEQLIHEDSFSFPSGHSMVTSTIYTMIIYLSFKYIKDIKVRNVISIISGVLIFLVGISRIYLRVHYFSDVLAGWILGIVITLTYSIVYNKISKRKILEDV